MIGGTFLFHFCCLFGYDMRPSLCSKLTPSSDFSSSLACSGNSASASGVSPAAFTETAAGKRTEGASSERVGVQNAAIAAVEISPERIVSPTSAIIGATLAIETKSNDTKTAESKDKSTGEALLGLLCSLLPLIAVQLCSHFLRFMTLCRPSRVIYQLLHPVNLTTVTVFFVLTGL